MEGLLNGWSRVLLKSCCYDYPRRKWRYCVAQNFYPVGRACHSKLPSSSCSRTSLRGGSEEFIARRKKGKGIAIAAIIITVLLPSFPSRSRLQCRLAGRPLAAAPVKAKAAPNGGNFGDGRTEGRTDDGVTWAAVARLEFGRRHESSPGGFLRCSLAPTIRPSVHPGDSSDYGARSNMYNAVGEILPREALCF